MAAEAEAVAHDGVDLPLLRRLGRVVEIARWIGRIEIDRRRADLIAEGQQREDQLDAAANVPLIEPKK